MDNDLSNKVSESYLSSKKENGFFEKLWKVDWSFWLAHAVILFSLFFGSFLLRSGSFVNGVTFLGVALISYYLLKRDSK